MNKNTSTEAEHKKDIRLIQNHIHKLRLQKKSPLTVLEIRLALADVLRNIKRDNPHAAIGYVAGCLTSDGPESIDKNLAKLEAYADYLRKKLNNPLIFSTKEVFSDEEQKEITMQGEKAQIELRSFWKDIQAAGYLSDLFMTPGWERSAGAKDEHKAAKENKHITIHYVKAVKVIESK